MYIIVAGGGKVGYYLAKELLTQGNEVLVIEKDPRRCVMIAEELGNIVLRGDAAEAATLMEAGTNRADVMAAVTGDDEDNLVICQVAKQRFHVKRTIARINNPKNERIFRELGVDATVSSTEVILSVLEQEIPTDALVTLVRLRHADVQIVETILQERSAAVGRRVRDLGLPKECNLSLVIRNGNVIFPTGDTVLLSGDEVLAFTNTANEARLRQLLAATR